MKKSFRQWLYDTTLPLPLELIKWIVIDLYRYKKYGKPVHFYGIHCVAGMYGQGKTTVMSKIGVQYREKFGDKIYISSNYGFGLQDFEYNNVKQLSVHYDKPILFLWDEVQNDFPATDKVFPPEVRKALTLNRKGNGKKFYWCSQDSELVHKTIRRLTIQYGLVRTLFNRYTRVRWYLKMDYEMLLAEVDVKKQLKIRPIDTMKFVQTDYLRSLFNSFTIDNGECVNPDRL